MQEIKKKIDSYITPNVPEVGMYEMTKNLFETALVKKVPERAERRLRKDDRERREETHKERERKEEKDSFKLDSLSKVKYIVPKPVTKTKNASKARDELFSEKFFKSNNNEGIKKKSAKEALLLPLIKSEM